MFNKKATKSQDSDRDADEIRVKGVTVTLSDASSVNSDKTRKIGIWEVGSEIPALKKKEKKDPQGLKTKPKRSKNKKRKKLIKNKKLRYVKKITTVDDHNKSSAKKDQKANPKNPDKKGVTVTLSDSSSVQSNKPRKIGIWELGPEIPALKKKDQKELKTKPRGSKYRKRKKFNKKKKPRYVQITATADNQNKTSTKKDQKVNPKNPDISTIKKKSKKSKTKIKKSNKDKTKESQKVEIKKRPPTGKW
jgi:hypothetical protein